jgi:hypothetical protein
LEQNFRIKDVPSWGLFGALLGYVLFFRVQQYLNFAKETGKLCFVSKAENEFDSNEAPATSSQAIIPATDQTL